MLPGVEGLPSCEEWQVFDPHFGGIAIASEKKRIGIIIANWAVPKPIVLAVESLSSFCYVSLKFLRQFP